MFARTVAGTMSQSHVEGAVGTIETDGHQVVKRDLGQLNALAADMASSACTPVNISYLNRLNRICSFPCSVAVPKFKMPFTVVDSPLQRLSQIALTGTLRAAMYLKAACVLFLWDGLAANTATLFGFYPNRVMALPPAARSRDSTHCFHCDGFAAVPAMNDRGARFPSLNGKLAGAPARTFAFLVRMSGAISAGALAVFGRILRPIAPLQFAAIGSGLFRVFIGQNKTAFPDAAGSYPVTPVRAAIHIVSGCQP